MKSTRVTLKQCFPPGIFASRVVEVAVGVVVMSASLQWHPHPNNIFCVLIINVPKFSKVYCFSFDNFIQVSNG